MTARPRKAVAALVLALACATIALAPPPAQAAVRHDPITDILDPLLPGPTPPPAPVPPPVTDPGTNPTTPAPAPPGAPPGYLGADGLLHPAASYHVPGNDGRTVFWGEDFDSACYDTPYLRDGFDAIAKIAGMIRRSGRTVVFTVAPNKASVEKDALEGIALPHGACARRGLRAQDKLLDHYRDPSYLPVRRGLVEDRRLMYWHQDTHWTGVGAGVYVKQLVRRLDPRVASRMRFVRSTASRNGMLAPVAYQGPPETAPTLLPGRRLKVHLRPGEVDIHDQLPTTYDHSWRTTPRSRTIPGRTLLIGDSFTYLSLGLLRPAFARGRYLWHGLNPPETVAQAIVDADTVVLEVLQRFTLNSPVADPAFRPVLRAALAAASPRGQKDRVGRGDR